MHGMTCCLQVRSRHHVGLELSFPVTGGLVFVDSSGKERRQPAMRGLGRALAAATSRHAVGGVPESSS